jgi:hypothetical protein
MSKQTIQQVEERQRLLILRIARSANELKDLDIKLKKMRHGKIKVAPPPGTKVSFNHDRKPTLPENWLQGDDIPL